ncbi:MAG: rhodanese-like domain-containing protein [Thiotrichaceae bacterium]|nr:rhodanese-like domain-containing protein [Thiotrichaceae bacterium]
MTLKVRFHQLLIVLFLFASFTACVKTDGELPDKKKTQLGLYLTSIEAYDVIIKDDKNILFIDVRTVEEVSKGLPTAADGNVPIQQLVQKKAVLNMNFVSTIEEELTKKALNQESRIILICQQGNRSAFATNKLAKAGYKNVYHVTDGVLGWKKNNLPWSN